MCSSPRAASEASEGGASAPPPRGEGRWGGQGRGRERKEWRRFRHDWRERTHSARRWLALEGGGRSRRNYFYFRSTARKRAKGCLPPSGFVLAQMGALARKLLGATAHSRLAKTWSHARTCNLCRARQPTLASNEGGELTAIQTKCRWKPPPRKRAQRNKKRRGSTKEPQTLAFPGNGVKEYCLGAHWLASAQRSRGRASARGGAVPASQTSS